MITIIEIPSTKTVGMKVSGKITKEGMEDVIEKVKATMEKTDERLNIYVELDKWEGFTLAALYEDIKFALPNMRRFAKEAIVTDKAWISNLVKAGDRLFPSIELRTYTTEEKGEALMWIQE
nr:STAS/SEC14 domain-containing protein [uncultured Pseudodesulfovibrio sp.]